MNFVLLLLICLFFPLNIRTEENILLTNLNIVLNTSNLYKINTKVQTFKELLQENAVFIDKTLMIKAVVNNHEKAVTITRPAKWGKSVTLHMIKDFLEQQMTGDGLKINKTFTWQYRLFYHGEMTFDNGEVKKLKNPLLITKDNEFLERYQGNYPVIYLTFKNVTWSDNCTHLRQQIQTVISDVFIEHHYLLLLMHGALMDCEDDNSRVGDSMKLKGDMRDFKRIMYCLSLNSLELAQSVMFLCRLLYTYFDKYAYIFIDDYDRPVMEILRHSRFSNVEEEFLNFFQSFLHYTFQENEFIAKGVLMGVLPVASQSYSTHTPINGRLVEFVGFFPEDVGSLLKHFKHGLEESEYLVDWYSGYKTNTNKNHVAFNPWSIVHFLNTNKTEDYWIKCENNDYLANLIQCNPSIRNITLWLVKNQKIPIQIPDKKGLTTECIKLLQLMINPPYVCDCNETSIWIFLSFSIAMGHVTVVPETLKSFRLDVRLPNQEIANEFRKQLVFFYKNTYQIRNFTLEDTAEHLYNVAGSNEKTYDSLKISFKELLHSFPSFGDISKNTSSNDTLQADEALLNSIVDIIAMQISLKHEPNDIDMIIEDPLPTGIIGMHIKKSRRGIIVKVKYNEESASKVLFGHSKKYKPILQDYNLRDVKYIGINVFSNKTVDVACLKFDVL